MRYVACHRPMVMSCGGLVHCSAAIPVLLLLPSATRFESTARHAPALEGPRRFIRRDPAGDEHLVLIDRFLAARPLDEWVYSVDTPHRASKPSANPLLKWGPS